MNSCPVSDRNSLHRVPGRNLGGRAIGWPAALFRRRMARRLLARNASALPLRRVTVWAAGFLLAASAVRADADFQGATHLMPFDEDTIKYSKTAANDAITRLQTRLDRGEVKLKREEHFGYLRSVLEALQVPKSSQTLVFSKTSFQRERIGPETPRALYFNDEVYIGFVVGSPLLEISTADPKLGGVFYTMEQTAAEKQRLVRSDQCLECHASAKTMGVPGHLVRSFEVDAGGVVNLATGTSLVSHRTPLADRWGGWYVTGTHGAQTHRGNLFGAAALAKQEKSPNFQGNLTRLDNFFPVKNYPLPTSDIVALMVLDHQLHMHNFITRLNYESTLALSAYGHLNYLKNITDSFLNYLLFTEEAPLTDAVKGVSAFTTEFAAAGPRDRRGRSLRQFDLKTRLFKYPCSYLIYTDAFDAVPAPMKAQVYQRLHEILTGKDTSAAFQKIPTETKRAILEILRETKPGLPDYWRAKK